MSGTPKWKWHYSDTSSGKDGKSNLWVIWTLYMPGLCGHLWNHTQHWRGPIPHAALHYPPIPLKKKGKTCWTGALLSKQLQNLWKVSKDGRKPKECEQSAVVKFSSWHKKIVPPLTWEMQIWKKKSKTVEGWKYPTSPGSFPEICVRSRTITVWNESDHWLKLILEREFLFSNPQQPGIKIPIGHFWR